MVHLRHANGFETEYLHLSSIAVRAGAHVRQGELIGRVGSTGLATGAHLDYRLKKNGAFINPVTAHRAMPPADPIPAGADGGVRRRARPRDGRARCPPSARRRHDRRTSAAASRQPPTSRSRGPLRYNLSAMATLHPFRALRPNAANASRIAAVPYDVVNTDEARALADGNPLSFLRVSRAEIELPAGTDPYADAVYQRAAENFAALRKSALVVEDEPSVYFYRLRMGSHEQTGLAACFSLDEYDRDIIKKHERTRRDKEDDRTRHMLALGAQTGPVFLTYRASADVDRDRRAR